MSLKRHCVTTALTVGVLFTFASAPLPAQGPEESKPGSNGPVSFSFDLLDVEVAQMIVLDICAEEPDCRFWSASRERRGGSVTVSGSPAVLARIGRELAQRDDVSSTHGFQVAVVEGTVDGEFEIDDLSDGARRALEDAARLLPFRGMRVHDVALIETSATASTRLSGPQALDYDLRLMMDPVVTAEGLLLRFGQFKLFRHAQHAENGESVAARDIISTSFEITPGETVVVGTSRLGDGGDSALIALVTALDPKGRED